MKKFKENLLSNRSNDERGDIVQTLLILVVFVVIVIAVGNILWGVIQGQANKVAGCLDSANPVSGTTECE